MNILPRLDFRKNQHQTLLTVLFTLAILMFLLRNSEQNTLLAIILLLVGFGVYMMIYPSKDATSSMVKDRTKATLDLDAAVSERLQKEGAVSIQSYMVKSFPKTGLKYLRENDELLGIAQNLMYLQVYDKARFQDMLLLMDRMQKIYMYTLVGRYQCQHGLTLFMDLRELLREKLYSFFIITPLKTKHMYGLDPHGELDRSIRDFTNQTRRMIRVLENYGRRECKSPYMDATSPQAVDPSASPHVIP